MRVEVTLKSGVTVTGFMDSIEVETEPFQASPVKIEWHGYLAAGVPSFKFLNLAEIAAIVCYPESADLQRRQNERNGEAAKPGGDQVDPGGGVEGRDPEQDGRDEEEDQIQSAGHGDRIPETEGSHTDDQRTEA